MTNFEKYKTADDRAAAFAKWCLKTKYDHECEDAMSCNECQFAWLDLEAEEKPLPCPFCGGEVIVSDRQVYCADETNCNYGSGRRKSRDEAISAHNRVARAALAEGRRGRRSDGDD